MSTNRSMPPAIIIPELPYADVREAVKWLCGAFGFSERLCIGNHRAQLQYGDGSLVVTHGNGSDASFSIMMRVDDIDAHYQHAKGAGVKVISPPTDDPYGERQYVVEDLGGHRWTFSQSIADIDPETWGGTLIS